MPQPAKVVARYLDNRVVKGYTMNFDPNRPLFTLQRVDTTEGAAPEPIQVHELKAVFFVKDFEGRPEYNEIKEFEGAATGRKLSVRFTDNEVLVGTSLNYDPARPGFFLFPADRSSNNDKVFVVAASVAEIKKL
jgi:hypothetical protein